MIKKGATLGIQAIARQIQGGVSGVILWQFMSTLEQVGRVTPCAPAW